MKTKLSLLLVTFTVLSISTYGQFSFGVSPGLNLNSAYFGYAIKDKIVPYIGFQFLNGKYNTEETGERFDYDQNKVVTYSDKTELSGYILLPNLGVKYFFLQKNKIKTYLSLCISKPFISGKLKHDETDDEEFNRNINNIKMWGGELGFGMEYFFDENFSLGGEFGFRHLNINLHDSYTTEFYNPNSDEFQETQINNNLKLNINPTFSKISLNFYF